MRSWRIAVTLVAVLIFGFLGSIAGPGWNPQPLDTTLVPETTTVGIGGDVQTDPPGTYEVVEEIVTVELDGATVLATLRSPVDAAGERPGVVFIHGAGTQGHASFGDIAYELASAGVHTLVPAKRLDTYSTRERDYVAMAEDYLRAVELLRDRPGVDAGAVGIYAESEGAFVGPVAAVSDPDLAFLVVVSAPVVTPRAQAAFATDAYLRNLGAPERLLRAVPRLIGSEIPGGGFEYADFDPGPYQRQLTQPVLIIYGTADASMPTVQGPAQFIDDMAVAGNTDYTVRYYADANHGIRIEGALAPGFAEDIARWTQGLPETASAAPRIAGAEADQRFRADPVASPRWYASGDMIVLWLLVGVGLIFLGPALWLGARVARRRTEPLPRPLARSSAALGLGVVAVWVLFLAYLLQVADLAIHYEHNPLIVQGGWLGVQMLGVVATGLGVASMGHWWRVRHKGLRTGTVATITLVGVHVGSLMLLVAAGYWGVFPAVV